jgi:hypothetical protein
MLEGAQVGRVFDIERMEVFSRHRFMAVECSPECLVASELKKDWSDTAVAS